MGCNPEPTDLPLSARAQVIPADSNRRPAGHNERNVWRGTDRIVPVRLMSQAAEMR
jgi:hypothetical protein